VPSGFRSVCGSRFHSLFALEDNIDGLKSKKRGSIIAGANIKDQNRDRNIYDFMEGEEKKRRGEGEQLRTC